MPDFEVVTALLVVLASVASLLFALHRRSSPRPVSAQLDASRSLSQNPPGGEVVGTVAELWIYPIKSCKGIQLTQSESDANGFLFDRRWMVVRPNGDFITQRQKPIMALLAPSLDFLTGSLTLEAPNMPPIQVDRSLTGEVLTVRVWSDKVDGIDQGDAVSDWLSKYLDTPCRLVFFDHRRVRPTDPKYCEGAQTAFADGFPFLIASMSSLHDLAQRCGMPDMKMNRFRPNVVVSGPPAFDEDQWSEFSAGDLKLKTVKPCSRCKIPTTNQETAEQTGTEPLVTMQQYRTAKDIGWTRSTGLFFGQNAVHLNRGIVRVGDVVAVQTRQVLPPAPAAA